MNYDNQQYTMYKNEMNALKERIFTAESEVTEKRKLDKRNKMFIRTFNPKNTIQIGTLYSH